MARLTVWRMPMSATYQLTKGYGLAFWEYAKFSISPYLSLARAVRDDPEDPAKALATCYVFTVIPVLPIATMFTFTLAFLAALLTAASAVVTYPVAGLIDLCSPPEPYFGYY